MLEKLQSGKRIRHSVITSQMLIRKMGMAQDFEWSKLNPSDVVVHNTALPKFTKTSQLTFTKGSNAGTYRGHSHSNHQVHDGTELHAGSSQIAHHLVFPIFLFLLWAAAKIYSLPSLKSLNCFFFLNLMKLSPVSNAFRRGEFY